MNDIVPIYQLRLNAIRTLNAKQSDAVERTYLIILFLCAGLMFFLPGMLYGFWMAHRTERAAIITTVSCPGKTAPRPASPTLL